MICRAKYFIRSMILLDEVRESRKDLKSYLEQRFEKLEGEVAEMRIALKAKGII